MTSFEFNTSLIGMKHTLQRFAMRLTSDCDTASDLLQDTYLKAITHRDKFVDFTNLKAWIFTIMKNTFINNYRRNLKENVLINGIQNIYYIDKVQSSVYFSPESNFTRGEIEKEIDSLNDEFRIPFRMHIDGYKYKEIAERLDLNIGTVKSRIFLSRQKLMLMLKDYVR